ncbi:beta barrel domain-containing protein [Paenibacillus lautus]|uniref:beta barrel domain-containing protein n=1 Tax=Paenibacillus lautus TaxID=1401 RepID=UPI001C7D4445|nr:hypothetical protein [Paenibacillus lautus]MBX4152277.1 hypothetical protein [Paenibacillus lautus]
MNVGDKVFLKAVGNNARGRKEVLIREDVITKIGRKYFEVGSGYKPLKFHIEGLQQETGGYIADWELYFTKQDILDEDEFQRLAWDIKTRFGGYGKVNLTLDQLRRIDAIIKE